MAIFKTSGVVSVVSGKLGGVVFSKNGRARSYAVPTNPNTQKQARIRGIFGTLMTDWAALSTAQQEAWLNAEYLTTDRLGDAKVIRGSQLYIKANTLLVNAGLPAIDAPPIVHSNLTECSSDNLAGAEWTADESGLITAPIQIFTKADAFKDGEYLHIAVSRPMSLGKRAKQRTVFIVAEKLSGAVITDGKLTLDVPAAINAGLGPSVYNNDSSIIAEVGIFDKKEGVVRPIGQPRYIVRFTAAPPA